MPRSISRSITATFRTIATHIDDITSYINDEYSEEGYESSLNIDGYLTFSESGTHYSFTNLSEFKDALIGENLDKIYIWNINFIYSKSKEDDEYRLSENAIDLTIGTDSTSGNGDGSLLKVSILEYSKARIFMDGIIRISESEYYIYEPEIFDSEEEYRLEIVNRSTDILNDLVSLQSRIVEPIKNEKEFQRFLYPILKSHFSTLQEEDYLPKLSGKASKPDFGITDEGVAYELKYNKNHDLKKIRDEILIDSREYFVKESPYKLMIVVIYNASGQPIPTNYIEDLESVDVIHSVVITPAVVPALK